MLLEFKKLLDAGAISQAEYDAKKRQLLNSTSANSMNSTRTKICPNCKGSIGGDKHTAKGVTYCSALCAKEYAQKMNTVAVLVILAVVGFFAWVALTPSGRDFMGSFSTGGSNSPSNSLINRVLDKEFVIEVGGTSGQKFAGNYGCIQSDGKNSSQTVEGSVPASYTCSGTIASSSFQKQSQSMSDSGELSVTIKSGGKILNSSSTTATFGVVMAASD